jgi:hypothetical protein
MKAMATNKEKIKEYDRLIQQLLLALDVYDLIETYEFENDRLPGFLAEEFNDWREWRIAHKLEKRKKRK